VFAKSESSKYPFALTSKSFLIFCISLKNIHRIFNIQCPLIIDFSMIKGN
jgi:hypothetical protein